MPYKSFDDLMRMLNLNFSSLFSESNNKMLPYFDEATKQAFLTKACADNQTTLNKAYKKVSLKVHPDKNGQSHESHQAFHFLNLGKKFLMSLIKKEEPDAKSLQFAAAALSESTPTMRKAMLKKILDDISPETYVLLRIMIKEYEREKLVEYKHAALTSSRTHAFSAKPIASVELSSSSLRGDALKTSILIDFKQSIDKITDGEALRETIDAFMLSDSYKVLKKGQGIATRLFSLKKDSIKAFESICNEAQQRIANTDIPTL